MEAATITQFQYMQSHDYVEAVSYAAKNAYDAHEKWFVFLQQDNSYICCNQAHVHPFTGVPCVAELHGQNVPSVQEATLNTD